MNNYGKVACHNPSCSLRNMYVETALKTCIGCDSELKSQIDSSIFSDLFNSTFGQKK